MSQSVAFAGRQLVEPCMPSRVGHNLMVEGARTSQKREAAVAHSWEELPATYSSRDEGEETSQDWGQIRPAWAHKRPPRLRQLRLMNKVAGKRPSIGAAQANPAMFSGSEVVCICELLQKERIVIWHRICCFDLVPRASHRKSTVPGRISPSRAWQDKQR
jgi:hypothetical protein